MRLTWTELTVPANNYSQADLLSEWRWLLDTSYQIVLVSSLGDLFLADAAGRIHWLDAGAARLTEVAASLDEFQQLRQQPVHATEWFATQMVGDLLQSGLRLARGQCFSYKVPPMLGGAWEAANFEPTDLSVHFSILGQVCRQVRDLPEGTPVSSVKVVPPAA